MSTPGFDSVPAEPHEVPAYKNIHIEGLSFAF
jgi:hypothetical protein